MIYLEKNTNLKFNIIETFLKSCTDQRQGIYISFRTYVRGVQISEHLKSKYQDEIVIVLEHQFDKLVIKKNKFSVNLYFGGELEEIIVPYEAITKLSSIQRDIQINFDLTEEDMISESHSLIEKTIDSFVNNGLLNQGFVEIKSPSKIDKKSKIKSSKNKKKGEVLYFPSEDFID